MKVAIIGCGSIAQVHAQVLNALDDVEFIACSDIIAERAQAVADKYRVKPYLNLKTLLNDESPDALHILTPHSLHTPMAEEAAARGIAIFCEKPPAISEEQWLRFQQLATRVPVGICFQNRFNPATQAAKKLLDMTDELGAVLGARAFVTWKRDAGYYLQSGWRGTWATEGGGVLINQAVHTLDLLVYLLGKPTACASSMHNRHLSGIIEVEDTVEARIDFGAVPCLFYASNGYGLDAPIMLEITCESGTIRLEGANMLTIIRADGKTKTDTYSMNNLLGKGYWGNGHYECIRMFYECLRENRQFPIGIGDIAETMNLLFKLYKSSGIQKPVSYK